MNENLYLNCANGTSALRQHEDMLVSIQKNHTTISATFPQALSLQATSHAHVDTLHMIYRPNH